MNKNYFGLALLFCALAIANCRERPREPQAQNEQRRDSRARRAPDSNLRLAQQIPFAGQSKLLLELEYTGGYLDFESDSGSALVDLDLVYDNESLRPEIIFDSTSATPRLTVRSPHDHRDNLSLDELRSNRWRIKVSRQVELECEISAGAVDAWLDFSGLRLQDLNLNVGAGELDLEFRERNPLRSTIRFNAGAATIIASGLCNANFEDFVFKGGAGKSELFFDGDYEGEGFVDLKFGVGLNTIRLDDELGVKIRKSGSFLAPISLRGFDKEGNYYFSPNYERATARLDFEIAMGVGHTSIKWIEGKD